MRSARATISVASRTETLDDESFPFEFSMPLRAGDTTLRLSIEAVQASGQTRHSETVSLQLAR